MAIEDITAYLGAGKTVLDLFKGIRDELPEEAKSKHIDDKIKDAEAALKASKVELAKVLGFRLCRCAFPPEIMLWKREQRKSVCPRCGDVYPPTEAAPRESATLSTRRR